MSLPCSVCEQHFTDDIVLELRGHLFLQCAVLAHSPLNEFGVEFRFDLWIPIDGLLNNCGAGGRHGELRVEHWMGLRSTKNKKARPRVLGRVIWQKQSLFIGFEKTSSGVEHQPCRSQLAQASVKTSA